MEQEMQSFGGLNKHAPSSERVTEMATGRSGCSEYLEGLHISRHEISSCLLCNLSVYCHLLCFLLKGERKNLNITHSSWCSLILHTSPKSHNSSLKNCLLLVRHGCTCTNWLKLKGWGVPPNPLTNISSSCSLAPALQADVWSCAGTGSRRNVSQHRGLTVTVRVVGQAIGDLILTWSHACHRPVSETQAMPLLSTSVVANFYQNYATCLTVILEKCWPDVKMLIVRDCGEPWLLASQWLLGKYGQQK